MKSRRKRKKGRIRGRIVTPIEVCSLELWISIWLSN